MSELNVQIEGLEELVRRFAESPAIVESEIYKAMRASVDHTEKQVAGRVPVNTGQLRSSIGTDVKGRGVEIQGRIGTPLIYGLPVERGRKKGKMPPIDALEYWVIRKGIAPPEEARSVAFAIAYVIGEGESQGIMRPGGGARMFEKGLEAAWPGIQKAFGAVPERILTRLTR